MDEGPGVPASENLREAPADGRGGTRQPFGIQATSSPKRNRLLPRPSVAPSRPLGCRKSWVPFALGDVAPGDPRIVGPRRTHVLQEVARRILRAREAGERGPGGSGPESARRRPVPRAPGPGLASRKRTYVALEFGLARSKRPQRAARRTGGGGRSPGPAWAGGNGNSFEPARVAKRRVDVLHMADLKNGSRGVAPLARPGRRQERTARTRSRHGGGRKRVPCPSRTSWKQVERRAGVGSQRESRSSARGSMHDGFEPLFFARPTAVGAEAIFVAGPGELPRASPSSGLLLGGQPRDGSRRRSRDAPNRRRPPARAD
jgi:hypothetical protein